MLIRSIHHLKQQIRIPDLIQGGTESLYQAMGQFADKSDRIRQKKILLSFCVILRTVVSGWQKAYPLPLPFFPLSPIGLHHLIHQGGFPRICGVAYQRHLRQRGLIPALTLRIPVMLYGFQLPAKLADPLFYFSSVQLNLLFTGTLIAGAAAGWPACPALPSSLPDGAAYTAGWPIPPEAWLPLSSPCGKNLQDQVGFCP